MTVFVDLFKVLRDSGLLTAAFIIGAIAVFIAIVGNIKALIELSSSRAFALAVFGIVLMGLSVGGYFISLQTTSTDTPAKVPTPVAGVAPTNMPQPTYTPYPTFTPFPNPTAVPPTNVLLPTRAPTLVQPAATVQATSKYRFVSLQDVGKRDCGNLGVQCGTNRLANVDFEIGWLATTQSQGDSNNPKTITVGVQPSISNLSKVYFLLQASWGTGPSKEFGSIVLLFADGRTVRENLTLGYNIRDWSDVNRPLTAPNVQQAWQGVGWDGRTKGVVDMLTINVPSDYRQTQLVRIEVRDESAEKLNSPDPGIHLWAITVE